MDKEKLAEWAKRHVNHVFIGGMALLVALRVAVLFLNGGGAPLNMPSVITVDLKPTLTVDSDLYKRVRRLIEPPVGFTQSSYRELAEFNMFDPRMAQNADQIRQQANQIYDQARQKYAQALAAVKTGDRLQAEQLLGAARKQVEDTLARQPSHLLAQQLGHDIEIQLASLQKANKNGQPGQGQKTPSAKP